MFNTTSSVIELLTDFGTRDWYVASMKGVILQTLPTVHLVDITHQVQAGNIRNGSFVLQQCYQDFPKGSIFLVVIDPGVGTRRSPLVLKSGGYYFVGPDNGIFSFLREKQEQDFEARNIHESVAGKASISQTFHGRDIFAPAAAQLAAGQKYEEVGYLCQDIKQLATSQPEFKKNKVTGVINFIDHYGNLITNIMRGDWMAAYENVSAVTYKKNQIPLCRTFGDVPENELTAYFGSGGYLEIAVNGGNASEYLGLLPGSSVKLKIERDPS